MPDDLYTVEQHQRVQQDGPYHLLSWQVGSTQTAIRFGSGGRCRKPDVMISLQHVRDFWLHDV